MFKKILKSSLIAGLMLNVNICLANIDLGTKEQQAQQAEQIKEIFLLMKKQGENLITPENTQKQLEVLKNTLKHIDKRYKKDLIIPYHLQSLENEKNI